MSFLEEITAGKWGGDVSSLFPDISKAEIRFEMTNACNHKCVFCPNSQMMRKKRFIDEELMYSMLDQCQELGIKKAAMFLNGEPFLNDKLADYVRYAKQHGMEYVYVTTNGGKATTEERLRKVFDAGIDSIKFSINGGESTYERTHGVDEYNLVIEHLKFAHNYRKENKLNYRILSGYVATDLNQYEYEKHYELIKPYIDDIIFVHPINMAGQTVDEVEKECSKLDANIVKKHGYELAKLPCALLFNSIVVSAEGYLTTCCEESFGNLFVHDLNEMSIKDAWHSQEMAELRKRHIEKRVEGIQCYNCAYNVVERVTPLNQKLFDSAQL